MRYARLAALGLVVLLLALDAVRLHRSSAESRCYPPGLQALPGSVSAGGTVTVQRAPAACSGRWPGAYELVLRGQRTVVLAGGRTGQRGELAALGHGPGRGRARALFGRGAWAQ